MEQTPKKHDYGSYSSQAVADAARQKARALLGYPPESIPPAAPADLAFVERVPLNPADLQDLGEAPPTSRPVGRLVTTPVCAGFNFYSIEPTPPVAAPVAAEALPPEQIDALLYDVACKLATADETERITLDYMRSEEVLQAAQQLARALSAATEAAATRERAVEQLKSIAADRGKRLYRALSDLAGMYNQYTPGEFGHDFMSAGEDAQDALDSEGLLDAKSNAIYPEDDAAPLGVKILLLNIDLNHPRG